MAKNLTPPQMRRYLANIYFKEGLGLNVLKEEPAGPAEADWVDPQFPAQMYRGR